MSNATEMNWDTNETRLWILNDYQVNHCMMVMKDLWRKDKPVLRAQIRDYFGDMAAYGEFNDAVELDEVDWTAIADEVLSLSEE